MVRIKTVVYLDELLLVNFVASAVFLLGAGLLCGQRCAAARLVAGSAAGAAASLALLWPELPFAPALAYKAATCAGMVWLAYGWHGARGFLRLCAWALLLSLALTGAALLPALGVHSNNFSVYVPLSPTLLLACCGGVYAALRVGAACFGRRRAACCDAVLALDGCSVYARAFCDTGFAMQDALTGRAVVLLRYEAVRGQLPDALCEYLDAYFAGAAAAPPPELRVRLLPCTTVAGRCLLPAVRGQALTRRVSGRALCTQGVLAAFAAGLPPSEWTLLYGEDIEENS